VNSIKIFSRETFSEFVRGPLLLIAAVLSLFGAMSMWAVASPIGASPDETFHLPSIWCGHGTEVGRCEPGANGTTVLVPEITRAASCFAQNPDKDASCTKTLPTDLFETGGANADGLYPPVFYWVTSWFVSDDVEASVIRIRIFNALVFAAFAGAVAVVLGRRRGSVLLWSCAVTLVPLGMFLVPSVNPSSWAITSAAVVLLTTVGIMTEKIRWRLIALSGLGLAAAVVGAGARADSAIYTVLAVIVGVILTWSATRERWTRLWFPLAVALISLALFFSSRQSAADMQPVSNRPQGLIEVLGLTFANLGDLLTLWVGALGYAPLGWLDTPMPGIVWVSTCFIVFGLLFVTVGNVTKRTGVGLALVLAALVAIPLYVLVHNGDLVGSNVQPRYIYPMIIILVTIVVGALSVKPRLTSAHIWMIASLLTIANSVAIHVNMQRYIFGAGKITFNLDVDQGWWWNGPLTPMTVWAISSVLFAVFAALSSLAIIRFVKPSSVIAQKLPESVPQRSYISF
jgi:hypothetical protein